MRLRKTSRTLGRRKLPAKLKSSALKGSRFKEFAWMVSASGLVALIMFLEPAQSGEPRISSITATNNVIQIHFDTEVNRTYLLQYSSNLLSTNWSNLYTAYSYPFPVPPYHIPDSRTNPARFYRLRATP